jgi:hypothetical protein
MSIRRYVQLSSALRNGTLKSSLFSNHLFTESPQTRLFHNRLHLIRYVISRFDYYLAVPGLALMILTGMTSICAIRETSQAVPILYVTPCRDTMQTFTERPPETGRQIPPKAFHLDPFHRAIFRSNPERIPGG